MKFNLQMPLLFGGALVAAGSLSGCWDGGSILAEESGKYAICVLDEGQSCPIRAPEGTKIEKASWAANDDAIRVTGVVKTESECEGFAAHSRSRSPKHVSQVTINNTVVMPYGEDSPSERALEMACAKPPYNVSLTVAKAP